MDCLVIIVFKNVSDKPRVTDDNLVVNKDDFMNALSEDFIQE